MSSLRAAFAHRLAAHRRADGTRRAPSPDRDRGAALLTAVGFVLLISAIGGGLAALVTSGTNNRIALTEAREQRYAADGAIEEAITTVRGLDRSGAGACTAPGGSTSSTINDRVIRVDWRNACGVVRTSSGDLVMQRNVVFSACADRGTSCAANEVIIRAQVNFEQAATGAVSRASVQSWNVNAVPAEVVNGVPWTPAQLTGGLALWLDASDTSTITASGGAVSQWRDRSGNNRHAGQATATAQPLRVDAALGGRPALVFDGTNDVLNIPAYSVPQPYEMWAAFSLPVDPAGEADLWGSGSPVVVARPRWGGSTTRLVYAGGDFTSPRLTVGSHVWGVGFNGASSFDRLNGTLAGTGNAGTWSLGGGTRIGQGQNTSVFLSATVGELVVVPRSLSVADRERLEGYLAHKWGMAASLPANHPFKNAPPTV